VAAILRGRIRSEQLLPGARVPSITALMGEFGIARNTARRAIEGLKDEDLVTVRQGLGHLRHPPRTERLTLSLWSPPRVR
jgi:DNA-binding GntR family transcriptional regulator